MNNNGDHAAMQYSTWGLTMDLYNLNMTSVLLYRMFLPIIPNTRLALAYALFCTLI